MKLNEIFNKEHSENTKIYHGRDMGLPEGTNYKFKINNHNIYLLITSDIKDKIKQFGVYDISKEEMSSEDYNPTWFAFRTDGDDDSVIGTKVEFKIFSYVINAVRKYAEKNNSSHILFDSRIHDERRPRLYKKILEKFKSNGEIKEFRSKIVNNNEHFVIVI